MSNKKDVFENAPDWAKYYAVDADGSAFWYEDKPTLGVKEFIPNGNIERCTVKADNWQNSLIERGEESATLYNWDNAPDWANWAATDKNGMAYWYEREPRKVDSFPLFAHVSAGFTEIIKEASLTRNIDAVFNWKDSLEQRPQSKETKSDVIIDYKTEIQYLQNAVKELESVITEKNKVIEQLKTALTKLIKKANKLKQLI